MQAPVVEPLEDLDTKSIRTSPAPRLIMFVVLGLCAVMGWKYLGPRSAMADQGWSGDWDSAVEQAKTSGKPALVLFTADWCPACRQLESEVLSQSEVAEFLRGHFTLVIVDLTNREGPGADRAREFGVRSIPTMIRYDAANQEVARAGIVSRNALMAWLDRPVESHASGR